MYVKKIKKYYEERSHELKAQIYSIYYKKTSCIIATALYKNNDIHTTNTLIPSLIKYIMYIRYCSASVKGGNL